MLVYCFFDIGILITCWKTFRYTKYSTTQSLQCKLQPTYFWCGAGEVDIHSATLGKTGDEVEDGLDHTLPRTLEVQIPAIQDQLPVPGLWRALYRRHEMSVRSYTHTIK